MVQYSVPGRRQKEDDDNDDKIEESVNKTRILSPKSIIDS